MKEVLVDEVENKVVDVDVCDWLVDLLDDVLLVDIARLDDVPGLLVGILVVRDDDEVRVLDWTLKLEL